MIDDQNRIFAGFTDLSMGVDGGRLPNLIGDNQAFEAQNSIFREGGWQPRPPLLDVALSFDNPDLAYDADGDFDSGGSANQSVDNFHDALFQRADYYAPAPGQERLVCLIGGRLYQITPGVLQTGKVFEIQLARRNNSVRPRAYTVQAGIYLVVQNGQDTPIIFDGLSARRSGSGEIFTGLFMACGQGRIVLVGLNGLIFFGDIRDGKGNGDADMLGMTETGFLAEGGASALPSECGFPTAAAFLPQQDSPTGLGDLIVWGTTGAEGFTLSLPRETWKDSQFQRPVLRKIGCVGDLAIALANNDIFFRDPVANGWRSYRQARAEVGKWSQIPLSTNIRKWLKADTPELLNYCSAINFDNRIIATSTPVPNQGRLYHNGAVALDFDILSTFGESSQPAWDGQWADWNLNPLVGMRVLQFVQGRFNGVERAFAFILNSDDQNALVELQREPAGQDTHGPIRSRIITKSFDTFAGSGGSQGPMDEKKLYGGDVWIDEVKQFTGFSAQYRADQKPTFDFMDAFSLEPQLVTGPQDAETLQDGYDPRHSLAKPDEDADEDGTLRLLRRGFEFQFLLEMIGRARVRKFRAHAQIVVERTGPKDTP